jgi:hypothetical protein
MQRTQAKVDKMTMTAKEINERRERYERKIARLKREHRIDMLFFLAPIVLSAALLIAV